MRVVADTNVPVVANGRSEQASGECVLSCLKRLQRLTRSDKLVIDSHWLILREYIANLRSEGQPGPGNAFLKWVLTNVHNPRRCELVRITQTSSDETNFAEFPKDQRLKGFDPSDRKFVAVALGHSRRPPILQAVDRKWWQFKEVLLSHGVKVEFLCERDLNVS